MKKVILFTFAVFALMSCDQKVIQYPVSYSNDDFMKRSQERGKLFESAGTAVAVQNFSENFVMILMMVIFGALAYYEVSIVTLMVCFGIFFSVGILGLFYHIGKRNVLETAQD